VIVGRGKGGLMASLVAKKLRSPWTYAALEKGMETYPAQPTVHALESIYHYRAIERATRLIGVLGRDVQTHASIAVLNAGLARMKQSIRCVPLEVTDLAEFRKVTTALKKIDGAVVDEGHWETYAELAAAEDAARRPRLVDLFLRQDGQWHGYNTIGAAATRALANSLRERSANPDQPFHGRMVMIVGVNALANEIAARLHEQKAIMMIASHEKEAALDMAKKYDCRYVPFDSLYSTSHDVLIVCAEERLPFKKESADQPGGIHPGYLRPSITVMDLTTVAQLPAFAKAAVVHGCPVILPESVRLEQMALQVETLGGQEAPREVMTEVWKTALEEEGIE
jgi:3-dehydroquinate dehydratase/shikimate dehydrogenase